MKKIFFTVFMVFFALMAFALVASAAPTCGVPGTEGLPTCGTVSKSDQKCCIPPNYRGVKTVVKPGDKTPAINNNVVPVPTEVVSTTEAGTEQPAYAAAPNQVTANVISVTEAISAVPTTEGQASGSEAPVVAASSVKATKATSSSAKSSK